MGNPLFGAQVEIWTTKMEVGALIWMPLIEDSERTLRVFGTWDIGSAVGWEPGRASTMIWSILFA